MSRLGTRLTAAERVLARLTLADDEDGPLLPPLSDAAAGRRFAAAYAVGERRLFWQDDARMLTHSLATSAWRNGPASSHR
jgi:hypothetical protein